MSRTENIAALIAASGVCTPDDVTLGPRSAAVAFTIHGVTETVEGCGLTDTAIAEDVIRQLRVRLAHRLP